MNSPVLHKAAKIPHEVCQSGGYVSRESTKISPERRMEHNTTTGIRDENCQTVFPIKVILHHKKDWLFTAGQLYPKTRIKFQHSIQAGVGRAIYYLFLLLHYKNVGALATSYTHVLLQLFYQMKKQKTPGALLLAFPYWF